MSVYTFTLDVPAIGKAKKFNRFTGRGFNSDEQIAYMNLVTMEARGVLPPKLNGAVRVQIEACYEWPRSKWRTRYPRGWEPMLEKPDADNVSKAILDGLRGYLDDQRVFDLRVLKWRVPQGEPARTIITVEEITKIIVSDQRMELEELPLLRAISARAGGV